MIIGLMYWGAPRHFILNIVLGDELYTKYTTAVGPRLASEESAEISP